MTHVGQHGIYTFGGEGRRLSNWVYVLDPDTYKWRQVNTLGVSSAGHCTERGLGRAICLNLSFSGLLAG